MVETANVQKFTYKITSPHIMQKLNLRTKRLAKVCKQCGECGERGKVLWSRFDTHKRNYLKNNKERPLVEDFHYLTWVRHMN